MGKNTLKSTIYTIILSGLLLLGTACGPSKEAYTVRYEKAWKEVLKSSAWKEALRKENPMVSENTDFYASTDDMEIASGPSVGEIAYDDGFADTYDFLVHRAYAKIIAEAEMADSRLEREYLNWNAKNKVGKEKESKAFGKQEADVNKRYYAHRKMLEGLKSWNIFSEFGTDDLDFFKVEHAAEVRRMLHNGQGVGNVVGFLVYKLADLYHFEE
ncbi:hypothetical protein [Maribacter halichondriae]|uniref:hypothetical protein n=1 Tax=Maribacter halichondriae TaxID=2980554 RepID=UPI00235A0C2B|nr:hypothetical protein [Maribacter sp. Hal144]